MGSRIWSESDNHIHCHSSHDVDPWHNTLYHDCSHHSNSCDSFCALEAKVKERATEEVVSEQEFIPGIRKERGPKIYKHFFTT